MRAVSGGNRVEKVPPAPPAASAAGVRLPSTSATPTSRPSASVSRRANATARSELPPSSKKLASTLIDSADSPSTPANAKRAAASEAERGATMAAASAPPASAAGSCLRSILPLLVRGHALTPITSCGSMYAGSCSRMAFS